jgi:hypothetical protein
MKLLIRRRENASIYSNRRNVSMQNANNSFDIHVCHRHHLLAGTSEFHGREAQGGVRGRGQSIQASVSCVRASQGRGSADNVLREK